MAESTKSVLVMTADAPAFAGSGSGVRQAHLLAGLATAMNVDLVTTSGDVLESWVHDAFASTTQLSLPRRKDRGRTAVRRAALEQALGRGPSERADSRPSVKALRAWWSEQDASRWDFVLVEHAGLARVLPRHRVQPWGLTLHNVASSRAREQKAVTTEAHQRLLLDREIAQCRREETRILKGYDTVFAVSPLDASLLSPEVVIVPNGADVARQSVLSLPAAPSMLFLGALNTLPNIDALQWFFDRVWPALRLQVPEAALAVVGRDPLSVVVDLCSRAGVTLHQNVPDVGPYLSACRAVIAPVRIGSGTRLKALDGLAAARPVVGTSIALEGLDLEPGISALVEDDPVAFASALALVLIDDASANRIGMAGRLLAETRYDWRVIGSEFATAVLRAAR